MPPPRAEASRITLTTEAGPGTFRVTFNRCLDGTVIVDITDRQNSKPVTHSLFYHPAHSEVVDGVHSCQFTWNGIARHFSYDPEAGVVNKIRLSRLENMLMNEMVTGGK